MAREFDPKLTWNSITDDCINDFYKPGAKRIVNYIKDHLVISLHLYLHMLQEKFWIL